MYSTNYGKSHALVIGINDYRHVGPLGYAVNDAEALAELLKTSLGFESENVTVLLDAEATRANILQAFLRLAVYGTEPNDRVLVFFAGHGQTMTSNRGEVGFLVPSDGDPSDLSTLIRWDELTRSSDLIRAKHLLFLMDACYGGLAVTRSLAPGAMRFLRDMMQRVSRQVLTAGKADELVSDLGGPLPHHSVFTGHLLEALSGKAQDNYGNLTANGVIAYVYQAVGADPTAEQTPHYGYLQGDGDMIFRPLQLVETEGEVTSVDERLVSIPATLTGKENSEMDELKELKELLSEEKHRIQLYDFVAQSSRELLSKTAEDYFPVQGSIEPDSFADVLHRYEAVVEHVLPQEMLLCRWGGAAHSETVRMPLSKLSERIVSGSGSVERMYLRWYPVFLLLYGGGLGAIAGNSYKNFFDLLHTPVPNPFGHPGADVLLTAITQPMTDISDRFKWLPEHERHHVPRSEYMYKLLQPLADDTLFLGLAYEAIFDRVELLYGLEYLHVDHPDSIQAGERVWGPIGRFGWKGRIHGPSPLQKLVTEAKKEGATWAPLAAGFFDGSLDRFQEVASGLNRTIASLGWY